MMMLGKVRYYHFSRHKAPDSGVPCQEPGLELTQSGWAGAEQSWALGASETSRCGGKKILRILIPSAGTWKGGEKKIQPSD